MKICDARLESLPVNTVEHKCTSYCVWAFEYPKFGILVTFVKLVYEIVSWHEAI